MGNCVIKPPKTETNQNGDANNDTGQKDSVVASGSFNHSASGRYSKDPTSPSSAEPNNVITLDPKQVSLKERSKCVVLSHCV